MKKTIFLLAAVLLLFSSPAFSMGWFPESKPKPPPEDVPPVQPPPAPVQTTITERGRYSGKQNPPWWNFYFNKKLEAYPDKFTLTIGKDSFVVTIGTRRRGGRGVDGPDGKFYIKQSDVPGRGMAIGIHRNLATKDVSVTYPGGSMGR